MIRSSCVHCGASLWRGVERDIGQTLVDVAPLTVEEEAQLLVASFTEDGERRRRLTYDILTIHGKDAPVIECRRPWKPDRPRGYVVITHRCGQPPARRLPFFPEVTAGDDDPPFFPQAGVFSPAEQSEAFPPPHADLFFPGTETEIARALLTIVPGAIRKGTCTLCGLRVERKAARLCNRCSGFAHGRIYDERNTPVVGWCEVGSHRRRAATRNTSGLWDCGRHTPARNTPAAGATLQPRDTLAGA